VPRAAESGPRDSLSKVMKLPALEKRIARHRAQGKRIVHCHGCFDVVHPGHLRYLQFARTQGDILVVSLTSDDAIEKEDGVRPHVPQELRAEMLAAESGKGQQRKRDYFVPRSSDPTGFSVTFCLIASASTLLTLAPPFTFSSSSGPSSDSRFSGFWSCSLIGFLQL
jgi:cytidyltransferase-like protein